MFRREPGYIPIPAGAFDHQRKAIKGYLYTVEKVGPFNAANELQNLAGVEVLKHVIQEHRLA
jgi:hypothetical protein